MFHSLKKGAIEMGVTKRSVKKKIHQPSPQALVVTKVLVIAILAIVLVALVYVFFGKEEVVGKAAATEGQEGYVGEVLEYPYIIKGNWNYVCEGKNSFTEDALGPGYAGKDIGSILDVGGKFEALCYMDGGKYYWYECDADGEEEGGGKVSYAELVGKKYVCVQEGDFERWKSCDSNTQLVLDGKYLCGAFNPNEWQECSSSLKNLYSTLKPQYFCDGSAWVKQGSSGPLIPLYPNFYWEEGKSPIDTKDVTPCDNKNKVTPLEEVSEGGNLKTIPLENFPPVCCPSTEYCSGLGLFDEDNPSYFCYHKGTAILFEGGKHRLCEKINNNYLWLLCDVGHVDKVYGDLKYLCSKSNGDYRWEICTQNGVLKANNFYCENQHWKICNSTISGTVTQDGQYYCNSMKWGKDFEIAKNQLYEIRIVKGNDPYNKVIVTGETGEGSVTYNTLELCDDETEGFASQATLCYGTPEKKVVVDSIKNLATGDLKPKVDGKGGLFLFTESDPKTVSILLVKDVSSKDVELDLPSFTKSLLNNRRLALHIKGEYYVISHPKGFQFEFEKATVTHIPTLATFTFKKVAGNKYQFKDDTRVVTFSTFGEPQKVRITSLLPEEAPGAYAVSQDLSVNYELLFSKSEPLTLTDLGNKVLTVCGNDNTGDAQTLLLCENNEPKLTLPKDVLKAEQINGKPVALLYQLVNGKKQGYVFYRYNLSGSYTDLNYNNFVDDLRTGRRVALTFQGATYLLGHPVSNFTSLPQTSLTSYNEGVKAQYPASGGEKKVEFLIPEGKLLLERNYGVPPPPFKMHGLTKKQITETPVDLKKQLFASFSTDVPVSITVPDMGIIAVNDEKDIKSYKPQFKIEQGGQNLFDLLYNIPMTIDPASYPNVLVYYFAATVNGKTFVKTAKLYYMYDITVGEKSHDFNDQFLEVFTSGNELALAFDGQYYLLGYEGATQDEKQFFELEKLTLRVLNGTQEFAGSVDAITQTVDFVVLNGKVSVTVDPTNNKIMFAGTGKEALITEKFDAAVSPFILTNQNKVKVSNTIFSLCDNNDTIDNSNVARVCKDGAYIGTPLSPNVITSLQGLSSYFMIYKGVVASSKQVLFYQIKDLPLQPLPSWGTIAQQLKLQKSFAYSWKGKYFELAGNGLFNSMMLRTIPSGQIYPVQNIKVSNEGWYNGTFVYNHSLLFAQQLPDKDLMVQFMLKELDYSLVTDDGLVLGDGAKFITAFDGTKYTLEVKSFSEALLKVSLKSEVSMQGGTSFVVYAAYLPKDASGSILLPNGKIITLTVLDVKNKKVMLST